MLFLIVSASNFNLLRSSLIKEFIKKPIKNNPAIIKKVIKLSVYVPLHINPRKNDIKAPLSYANANKRPTDSYSPAGNVISTANSKMIGVADIIKMPATNCPMIA